MPTPSSSVARSCRSSSRCWSERVGEYKEMRTTGRDVRRETTRPAEDRRAGAESDLSGRAALQVGVRQSRYHVLHVRLRLVVIRLRGQFLLAVPQKQLPLLRRNLGLAEYHVR